jgi:excisionase family DNA binding protein
VEVSALEKHYTVDQVAEIWNISRDSVRRLFLSEDGVLRITRPGNRYKRTYTTLRIPESVLHRVYRRMSGGGLG